jgi:hypothetical protein
MHERGGELSRAVQSRDARLGSTEFRLVFFQWLPMVAREANCGLERGQIGPVLCVCVHVRARE